MRPDLKIADSPPVLVEAAAAAPQSQMADLADCPACGTNRTAFSHNWGKVEVRRCNACDVFFEVADEPATDTAAATPAPAAIGPMDWDTYRALDAVNRSLLDKIQKSPLHLQWHELHEDEEESAALLFGRLLHTLILEPERFAHEFAVFTGAVRRGKEWDKFKADNEGRTIIKQDELELAKAMQSAVQAHPRAAEILAGAATENVALWTDEATGIACKARVDIIRPGQLFEFKTTRDIGTRSFERDAYNYGYHRQAAWYLDGYKAATGKDATFGLIVIEKQEPYAVRVFETMGPKFIDLGRRENAANLALYAECLERDYWPGFDQAETLDLPGWVP